MAEHPLVNRMSAFPLLVYAIYLATGAAVGLLSGLFGIGGGLVMVPALLVCFTAAGVPADSIPPLALGTSLSVICFASALTSRENLRVGCLAQPFSKRMLTLVGFLATGVVVGARASMHLPLQAVLLFIGVLQIAVGAWMWSTTVRPVAVVRPLGEGAAAQDRLGVAGAGTLLFVTGGISSIGGIGGAIFMTPYFTKAGIEFRQAAALSTFFGSIVGGVGFVSYGLLAQPTEPVPMSIGYVSVPAFASMAAGSVLLVRHGARLSRRLSKATLTRGFCCFLFASGLKLLLPLGLVGMHTV